MRTKMSGEGRCPVLFSQSYLEFMAEQGHSIEHVLRSAKIPFASVQPNMGLTYSEYMRLLDEVHVRFGGEGIGLELGNRLPLTALGSFGHAVLASATLGDALRLCERFWLLYGIGMSFSMDVIDGICVLDVQLLPLIPERHRQIELEYALTGIYRACVLMQPELLTTSETWFDFAVPPYVDKARLFLGTVRYDMPACQIRFPALLLDTPLMLAHPAGQKLAVARCEEEAALLGRSDVAGDVLRALKRQGNRYPDFEQVARQLNMTARTLRRRLKEEEASFLELLNSVRRKDAMSLLANPDVDIYQVAEKMGYVDPANFTRAFRQWVGQTPSQYRKASHPDLFQV
ncbi:AraC family transcriptional regulator ligand-binding domain-containing protein [Pseudomonas sp. MAC6]|uniref:AraC family transcriptional regulator ligand-binding domain-containing protein n=1 Tax=Pseudomonas sp. MAC6 TaxID=3401633 RepID=UPI003BF61D20